MPRGVRETLPILQLARERCANWEDSTGRCFGWSVEALKNQGRGPIKPLDKCCLKAGTPCDYFERCVLSRIVKKEDPKAMFGYHAALASRALITKSEKPSI